ncbi:MFS transporter [Streptomyces sp. NBC_01387]|uniref:MFS transporter n=1 Tax=unclassified Streptomyces TaxID=2593676 RepID=UPI002024E286|nr:MULTISPECIES: MFS transporter [unclassified Streptomyces]MCX4553293.1 MFS transporter [Streptomyces sp. NBC_01500]WSV52301.1 MFS transporter [Streptomyces sp. NBC_01014]
MRLLSAYRRLFSLPGFGPSLFAAVAGKLQPGIFALALLLEVSHYRGMGRAAAVVSMSALASATLPLRGRLMDKYGYARVMCPALLLYLTALTGLVLNEGARGSFSATAACATVAGISAPPVQIVTRLMWRSLATGDLRTTVLSLDAVLTDVGFVAGPTLAAFLVTAVAPWAGLAASALLSTSATLLLLSRHVPQQRNQQPAARDWMGPLRSVPLRHTMTAAVLFFLAVRAVELAFPAWAQEHSSPMMSGVLLSGMAVGSVVGGLVLGALPPVWAGRAGLPVTLTALCFGTLLVAAASQGGGGLLVAAAAVMGLALGPTFVALFATAGDLSPANMAAETQSWISSFMSLGGAVGAAVTGLVSRAFGSGTVLVVAAASMAAASGLARFGISKQPVSAGADGLDL